MIKVSTSLLIFAILAIITAKFKIFIIIYSIVTIHELGHMLMARFLKWRILGIKLYPYGGMALYEERINVPLIQELLVTISGPLIQVLLFGATNILNNSNIIALDTMELINQYNLIIMLFNLLPVWPLDGAKLLYIFTNKILPLKKSHLFIIKLSYINLIIIWLCYQKLTANIVIILIFLLMKIKEESRNHEYLFNRFLLERYLNRFKFKHLKTIDSNNINYALEKFFRDHYHFVINGNNLYSEEEILKRVFNKRNN